MFKDDNGVRKIIQVSAGDVLQIFIDHVVDQSIDAELPFFPLIKQDKTTTRKNRKGKNRDKKIVEAKVEDLNEDQDGLNLYGCQFEDSDNDILDLFCEINVIKWKKKSITG